MTTKSKPETAALPFKSGDRVVYLNPNEADSRDGTMRGTVLCAGPDGTFICGIARDDNECGGYFGGLWGLGAGYSGPDDASHFVLEDDYESAKKARDERRKPKIVTFARGECVKATRLCASAPLAKQPGNSLCVHADSVGFVRHDDGVSDKVTVYFAAEIPRKNLVSTGRTKRPGGEVV